MQRERQTKREKNKERDRERKTKRETERKKERENQIFIYNISFVSEISKNNLTSKLDKITIFLNKLFFVY